MPTIVKIVEWEQGWAIPLHELDGEMYAIPEVGAPYWRGNVAMRVREVEDGDPPRVHLEHDRDRERAVLDGLPEGLTVDCGRDSDTGQWHALVHASPDGRIIGHGLADDGDSAVAQAVAEARERTGAG